jgi:hypothetical protein
MMLAPPGPDLKAGVDIVARVTVAPTIDLHQVPQRLLSSAADAGKAYVFDLMTIRAEGNESR